MPSYVAMKELVRVDKAVMSKLDEERQEEAQDYFNDLGQSRVGQSRVGQDTASDIDQVKEIEGSNWVEKIGKNPNTGKNEKSIANIVLIPI